MKYFKIKNETTFERMYKIVTIFGIDFKFTTRGNDIKFLLKQNQKLMAYTKQLKYFLDSCCDITQCKKAKGNLRTIQNARKKGLQILIKILEENNIAYWIDAGSLLGAYRHKGAIPWDDDVDIATDRYNYNKMQELLPKIFENTDFEIDQGRDETGYYTKLYYKSFELLDIFVYDYCNIDIPQEVLYKRWLKGRKKFYRKHKVANLRNGKVKIKDLMQPMFEIYNKCKLIDSESNNNKVWLFKGFDAATLNKNRNIFLVDKIFPLQRIQFEDIEVFAPNDIMHYLTNVNTGKYGDIMSFPPLTVTHIYFDEKYEGKYDIEFIEQIEKELDAFIK